MILKEQLDNDLKDALRSKDMLIADTLRMLKARIKNDEIAKGKEFSDEQVVDAIFSEVKKRKDSMQQYLDGGRQELADKEQDEIKILSKYLPAQLTEEEVKQEVVKVVGENNFSQKDFGKAMGILTAKLKGKTTGDVISKILKETLK